MDGSSFSRNVLPITLLSITALAVAGLVAGWFLESALVYPMGWILFGVLSLVALADLFVVRLVLDSIFAAAPERISSSQATLPQIVDSACALVLAFSTAPAVSGLVCAIFTGVGWSALPLALIGVVTSAVTSSRVRAAAEQLRYSAAVSDAAPA